MKQIALLFLLLIVMMFAVYWLSTPGNNSKVIELASFRQGSPSPSNATPSVELKNLKVGKNTFKVEVVDDDAKRQVGLSDHTSLDKENGMLFVFEELDVRPSFWMKGMDFPIDILWIDNGKVVQINADTPTVSSGLEDSKIPKYVPNQPVDYVLEIAAGVAKEKGIKVGDIVELPKL